MVSHNHLLSSTTRPRYFTLSASPSCNEVMTVLAMTVCFTKPPIMVCVLPPGEGTFIKQLMNFDKDNISDRVLKKIGQYCAQPDFQPEIIGRVSLAAKSLCMWVRAMEVSHHPYCSAAALVLSVLLSMRKCRKMPSRMLQSMIWYMKFLHQVTKIQTL
jgi:hypothetical protein